MNEPPSVSGQINPYAPTDFDPVAAPVTGAEAIRRQHIGHEASIKSIGSLYILGALFMVPIGGAICISALVGLASGSGDAASAAVGSVVGAIYLVLGLIQVATAVGLYRLQPWSRIVATVLSAIGLLAIPIGTLISAYFLYLLLCKKGSYIFSEEYKEIVAQTPHVKYKTSIIVWIVLGLLLVLLVVAIAMPLMS